MIRDDKLKICFKLVHYLLKNCQCEVRPLVRLHVLGKLHKCKELYGSFDYNVGFDIPEGNSLWKFSHHTHNGEQVIIPDIVFGKGPTRSTSTLLNGSSTGRIGFSGATKGFWLRFQPLDKCGKPCKT